MILRTLFRQRWAPLLFTWLPFAHIAYHFGLVVDVCHLYSKVIWHPGMSISCFALFHVFVDDVFLRQRNVADSRGFMLVGLLG